MLEYVVKLTSCGVSRGLAKDFLLKGEVLIGVLDTNRLSSEASIFIKIIL